MNNPKFLFRAHAVQRMFERKVSVRNVVQALRSKKIIEDYSGEMPETSQLILGFQGKRPFHMVTAEIPETNEVIVVTVYIPDPNKWNKDFMSRK